MQFVCSTITPMNPTPSLKTAVIGVGSLGQHHARVYANKPNVELVAVVDASPERAQEIAARHNTQALDSIDDLDLNALDAASVVVPTKDHYEVAEKLMTHGVHCLVEKPITLTASQGRELCRLADEHGVVLQVGHIERFNPAVVALAGVLTHPLFIETHRLGPPTPRVQDVGVVLDLMIHDLDLIMALVQSEVLSFDAVGVPVLTGREDIANVRLRFGSGCVANVTASRVTAGKQRKIRFFQQDSYVSLDYMAPSLEVYRKMPGPDGAAKIEYQQVEIVEREPLEAELSSFLDAVRGEHPPLVTGQDGVRALELAEQIAASIASQVEQLKL